MPKQLIFCWLVTALFCCGCGPRVMKTEPVSGVVTMDGTPLPNALIGFVPKATNGAPAYGRSDAEGKYKIQTSQGAADAGTLPGEYIVTVSCTELVPSGKKQINSETGAQEDIMNPKETLPPIYQDTKRSPLNYTVVTGPNTFDIQLTKKP